MNQVPYFKSQSAPISCLTSYRQKAACLFVAKMPAQARMALKASLNSRLVVVAESLKPAMNFKRTRGKTRLPQDMIELVPCLTKTASSSSWTKILISLDNSIPDCFIIAIITAGVHRTNQSKIVEHNLATTHGQTHVERRCHTWCATSGTSALCFFIPRLYS